MSTLPIRTITLGIAEAHPLSTTTIQRAKTTLQRARERYIHAGYEVQTVRVSTRPIFDDLAAWSSTDLLRYGTDLQHMLDDVGLEFCSVGPAQAARPDFPLERLDLLADLLAATQALNATVQLATAEHGLRFAAALPTARIIKRLAQETTEGFGNFRFAMLACVNAGGPFFPAAYHAGPTSLTIGLQGASIIRQALQKHGAETVQMADASQIAQWVTTTVVEQATPTVELARQIAREQQLHFGGIDLSPAPMGEDSIVAGLELCGHGKFGSPGTLAAVAAITAGLKQTPLPTCGYCGLMLPVLEDALLGQRWQEEKLTVHQLLLYSAVCGTGLDTIPLAGNSPAETIAHLLLDIATLALRLQKPLSARLFPVPGKQVGEHTTFTSPYLTNTTITM